MRGVSGSFLPKILSGIALLILLLLYVFAEEGVPPEILTSPVTPSPLPSPVATEIPPIQVQVLSGSDAASLVPVVKVVDGDTLTVSVAGKRETIRLIGVNTPETVDPRRPVECFGREASDRAKMLLTGQSVRLEADPTQADRDRYSRLLRYVYLPDGRFVNQLLIEEGYAYEYTYERPYRFQAEFKAAQQRAQEQEKGLWGNAECNK